MPGLKPPSRTKPISVPIFAVSWHTSPALLPKHVYACSGGGGASKTGIANFIEVVITCPRSGETNIKIDTGDDVGVAVDLYSFLSDKEKNTVTLLVAVGIQDSVVIYSIALEDNDSDNYDGKSIGEDEMNNAATLIGSLDCGKDFLTNTVAFDALGGRISVGGESNAVFVCRLKWQGTTSLNIEKEFELSGHIKGICKITCHPTNPNILLTSAKDGTCKVWDLKKSEEDKCLDTLECKIYDPNDLAKKKNIPKKILNPAPGQCLVKGCAFADLQGQYIYTVQSGRRGNAFLSIWRITRIPIENKVNQPPAGQEPPQFRIGFQEQKRIKVAEFPISAVSLSGDFEQLALGDTNGTVMLLNTETWRKVKSWEEIHDLPVTCIAARPLPLPLAGEDKTGVAIDAICASADSKMCFLTKQRKSTLKKVRKKRAGGRKAGSGISLTFILMMIFLAWAIKVSFDVCSDELEGGTSLDDLQHIVVDCVIHTVWWASPSRPGVAFVPT